MGLGAEAGGAQTTGKPGKLEGLERTPGERNEKSLEEEKKYWIEEAKSVKGQQRLLGYSKGDRALRTARTSGRRQPLEEGVAGDGEAEGGGSRREELWQGRKASRLGGTW